MEEHDPFLKSDILHVINPSTRGDPELPLRWISKSLKNIVKTLKIADPTRKVSVSVVRRILNEEGFSLQANRKTKEGGNHPDRDKQFEYINKTITNFSQAGNPIISVDAKKKELIGNFKNAGREWNPKSTPDLVNVYDFLPKNGIKAVPYGIYDLSKNQGFVNIGVSADTSVFAGKSILEWWKEIGNNAYPHVTALLILADGGGSNGSRVRLWKVILQQLADKMDIPITICHYPPGTSKWNKIEHRLFAPISLNWRGQPLKTIEQMAELISHTTNSKGLKVECRIDKSEYRKGIKISDNILNNLNLKRNIFHGNWNYMLFPRRKEKI